MGTPAAKEYDIIIFGATGYTGKLCAEHITLSLPTDLKWGVAGRSASKLSALVDDLRSFNPDRRQPSTSASNNEHAHDLTELQELKLQSYLRKIWIFLSRRLECSSTRLVRTIFMVVWLSRPASRMERITWICKVTEYLARLLAAK